MFQLLVLPQYQDVEKIKTIGSTYMAATGLQPGLARQQVSYSGTRTTGQTTGGTRTTGQTTGELQWYQEYWPDNRRVTGGTRNTGQRTGELHVVPGLQPGLARPQMSY